MNKAQTLFAKIVDSEKKSILYIVGLGLVLRIVYLLFFSSFFAKAYLGTDSIFWGGGDFSASLTSFENLIKHGTYSVNLNSELGYYHRMPGYSFFIGIITLLVGTHYNLYVICGLQILLDVCSIYIIYKIGKNVWNSAVGLIIAFLYATHPIIILWSPVLLSDTLGTFFTLIGLYFYSKENTNRKWFWLGFFIGIGTLIRPQNILTIPSILLIECWMNRKQLGYYVKATLLMGFAVLLTYGLYPMRNVIFHHKLVLFQDLRGSGNVTNDATVNYIKYIFSVQSKWEPTWSNIMNNEPITIDKAAFAVKGDSAILMDALHKAQTCSYSFSCWNGYWRGQSIPATDTACDVELAKTFEMLRNHQMQSNAFHFWITLPLENLKKCFFKSNLAASRTQSPLLKFVPIIFYYRTLILLLGLFAAIFILIKYNHNPKIFFYILFNFLGWYLLISAGTLPQLRDIEMRYLLPVDVLLLIPVGVLIEKMLIRKV